ncbi:molybdopterin converting factor subunit 1 [Kordiimonas aquimaris]|uniref:molybdopterin converting factor subunit 1 n=1 Tax=Kordiimonas aquimaris TaxID=707591 RepID=UPI0021CE0035|nr:molybdopterin converting factor subunit 1 [Kordiimonas aquimaris]
MIVKYFSWIRENIGQAEETLSLPDTVKTVADLLDYLSKSSEGHAAALDVRGLVRVAVNQIHVQHDHALSADDEIAIFPPVTGG